MRLRWIIVVVSAGIMTLASARSARAELVTWEFAGEITEVYDPDNLFDGMLSTGAPFSGHFTFDLSTPDSNPNNKLGAFENAVTDLNLDLDGLDFIGPTLRHPNAIYVQDGFGGSLLDSYHVNVGVQSTGIQLLLLLNFNNNTGEGIVGDSLRTAPLALPIFHSARFALLGPNETDPTDIEGTITHLVPEPAAVFLLLIGICVAIRVPLRLRNRVDGDESP